MEGQKGGRRKGGKKRKEGRIDPAVSKDSRITL